MVGLTFEITFHGPMRIGTGRPGASGADLGVDVDDPIPATSLKGLFRATATRLGCPPALVDEVFGSTEAPSPWWFSSGRVTDWRTPDPVPRSQVSIDPTSGTARPGALFLVEELWPRTAEVTIEPLTALAPDIAERHQDVLLLAATGTHALGASRRRGAGWITIARTPAPTDADIARAVALVTEAS